VHDPTGAVAWNRSSHRSFGSSPHKKKYWLALLDMHAGAQQSAHRGALTPLGRAESHTPVSRVRCQPAPVRSASKERDFLIERLSELSVD
jgi:hypothetical protein